MCNIIKQAKIFHDKNIELVGVTLTPSDMECISLFLISFFNAWVGLSFWRCYIQNIGLNILHNGLCHSSDVTIDELWLRSNALTAESCSLISELIIKY